jgi:hypothetical protein
MTFSSRAPFLSKNKGKESHQIATIIVIFNHGQFFILSVNRYSMLFCRLRGYCYFYWTAGKLKNTENREF